MNLLPLLLGFLPESDLGVAVGWKSGCVAAGNVSDIEFAEKA